MSDFEPLPDCYGAFAAVYDRLMEDIPYEDWCGLLVRMLDGFGIRDGLVAELGCGTGTLTELLARRGFDMIGIDSSEQMLSRAAEKKAASGLNILYLLQDMRGFELYGTVRAVVSLCDTMNYLADVQELQTVIRLADNYLDPGGVFIFDLKTDAYYRRVGDSSFSDADEEASYIWENQYDPAARDNEYFLTLFLPENSTAEESCGPQAAGGLYRRFDEYHRQHAFLPEEISAAAAAAGMRLAGIFDADGQPADEDCERVYVVLQETSKGSK